MNLPNGELVRIKGISWKWDGKVGRVCGHAKTLEPGQELVLVDLAFYERERGAPMNMPNEIYGIEERFLERVK